MQRGLPIRDLIKHFEHRQEDWIVKAGLRSRITFKEYHLLSNLAELGKFHLVIFRNELPHYASAAQIRVLRSLSTVVEPEGFLILGSKDIVPKATYGLKPHFDMPFILKKDAAFVEPEEIIPERVKGPEAVPFVPDSNFG